MHLKKILAYGISNLDVVGQAGTLAQIIRRERQTHPAIQAWNATDVLQRQPTRPPAAR
jgi:hypothetical protein